MLVKILALGVTAAPGITKMFLLFGLKHVGGDAITGGIASDINICSTIAYFTSVGWSVLVFTRTSSSEYFRSVQLLNKLLLQIMPWLTIGALILYVFEPFGYIEHLLGSVCFLAMWSFYQIYRSYFISKSQFWLLGILELIVISSTAIFLYWSSKNIWLTPYLPSVGLAIFVVVSLSYTIFVITKSSVSFFADINFSHKQALEFGLVNLASGGVVMAIVPIAKEMVSPDFAAFVAIVLSVGNIILLFPRAMSNIYLPKFIKHRTENEFTETEILIKHFFDKICLILLPLIIFTFVFLLIYVNELFPANNGFDPLLIFLLILSLTVGQFFLPEAIFLQSKEESALLLTINLVVLALFILASGLFVSFFHGVYCFSLIVFLIVLLQIFKGIYLKRIVNKMIASSL